MKLEDPDLILFMFQNKYLNLFLMQLSLIYIMSKCLNVIIKNNLSLMISAHQQNFPIKNIRLPKLFTAKHFRVRSASKDKFKDIVQTVRSSKKNSNQVFYSNDKYDRYRSSSLKLTIGRKAQTKKSQTNISSEQQNNESDSKLRIKHLKTDIKNCKQTLEKDHDEQMKKLEIIAKLFDPKRIMKMGKKDHTDHSQSENHRKRKNQVAKGNLKMKQFIYEENRPNDKKKRRGPGGEDLDQFWRKVNQSLILAPKNNSEQISTQLQEIYETFITQ